MSGTGGGGVIIIHNGRQRMVSSESPLYSVAIALHESADGEIVDPPEIPPSGTKPE